MQKLKVKEIVPNPENPRVIKDYKFKKLVKSIQEFPEMLEYRPIVINSDKVVLGGNMRLRACISAGLKEVPVIIAENLNADQEKEFIIKDNSSFGEWDWDLLANDWDTNLLSDWGLDIPKWEEDTFESEIEDTGDYDFPEDSLEGSHVKMVQLFLNTETEPLLKEWELHLREIHGTDNMTDTIFQVMKKAFEESNAD
jgi:hypothetical protein